MTDTGAGRPVRVLHLVGSAVSDELADLSLLYARDALATLSQPGLAYEHLLAHVEPDGAWSFPRDLGPAALAAAPRVGTGEALTHLVGLEVDLGLPQMFCVPGMTTYRALLDLLGIPFVGNTATVMALGAHKQRARALVAAGGVRVPVGRLLRREEVALEGSQILEDADLAGDVVVKPASADNSTGVTLVRAGPSRDTELRAALARAFAVDEEVLVEQFVPLGREVRCGVWETADGPVALPLEEYAVDAVTKPVRDEADKLRRAEDGSLELVAKDETYAWIVEAGPEDPVVAAVQQAALAAFEALGCRHYGLFDFRIDPAGDPFFLEAGLYCSFAEQSVLVAMGRAAGSDTASMFAVASALVRQA
ncbi:hypothetical protein KLP28_04890 [Nocardioidaceae bacterium]|nr:hypothetical protein KLP28_04890 [Nocardioidaceae bacterium]